MVVGGAMKIATGSRFPRFRGLSGQRPGGLGSMVTARGQGDTVLTVMPGFERVQSPAGKGSLANQRRNRTCLRETGLRCRGPNIAAPGASGQLPPANNLQTERSAKFLADPEGEYRIWSSCRCCRTMKKRRFGARLHFLRPPMALQFLLTRSRR